MKRSTINKAEVEKFDKIADEWWDPTGKFKPLHKFNPVRIAYIKKNILENFQLKNTYYPLKGLNILDVGCGGGLLAEPLSRLGANVTGIDVSEKNIKIAKQHLKKSNLKIQYICSSPENLKLKKKFDVILNMEVVEHVDNLNTFLYQTSKLLNNRGIMFVATINKTLKLYLFAIIGAEYILRWLPIGTHEWDKFVTPETLIEHAKNCSLTLDKISGLTYDFLRDDWKLSLDKSVNYIAKFKQY